MLWRPPGHSGPRGKLFSCICIGQGGAGSEWRHLLPWAGLSVTQSKALRGSEGYTAFLAPDKEEKDTDSGVMRPEDRYTGGRRGWDAGLCWSGGGVGGHCLQTPCTRLSLLGWPLFLWGYLCWITPLGMSKLERKRQIF